MTSDVETPVQALDAPVARLCPSGRPRVHVDLGELLGRVERLQRENAQLHANMQALGQVVLALNERVEGLRAAVETLAALAEVVAAQPEPPAQEPAVKPESSAGPLEHARRLREQWNGNGHEDRDLSPKKGYGPDYELDEDSEG